jgi:hypothetical protein
MIKILRKHRNWLMIVIAILALPFCLYFVKSDTSLIRSDAFVQMYGRKITMTEARHDERFLELANFLGMSDLVDGLAPGAGNTNQKAEEFIINLIVLRHEAERLGLQPSEAEIVETIRNAPGLQGQSAFDPAKYDQVERNILPMLGFTDQQLRELAADELTLKRIKQVVTSGVTIPESEIKSQFEEGFSKNLVSVIRVHSADFAKDIKPSDDEVKKNYDAHKNELKTDEKRKVEFVRLALTDDQKKLKDKERIDALQKLADRANDVSQALLEKGANFHQVAAKFQLPVDATGEFTTSAPDPKLKTDPQVNQAAFKLTKDEPNTDPIQTVDGFVMLHLTEIAQARPLSLDEAKPKIVDEIKQQHAREQASNKGRLIAEALKRSLKAGKPLPAALQEAGGAKPEKVEPFTLIDEGELASPPEKPKNEPSDMMMIKNIASRLKPGEASDFVPWADGGFIVLLEKRDPADPAKYQQARASFEQRYLKNAREYVFAEWLRDRQRNAGLEFAKG